MGMGRVSVVWHVIVAFKMSIDRSFFEGRFLAAAWDGLDNIRG